MMWDAISNDVDPIKAAIINDAGFKNYFGLLEMIANGVFLAKFLDYKRAIR